jgi:predicted Holliday junction resolvase-like endonuclease
VCLPALLRYKFSEATVFDMPLEDILLGLAIGLVFAILVYFIMDVRLKRRWAEQEAGVRKDAADRSRYVLKGKITEQFVPLLRDKFRYELADARFIGAPIDYLIFDGYSAVKDGDSEGPIHIVLADIKTGDAQLNRTERKIKEAVEAGRVRWETIQIDF